MTTFTNEELGWLHTLLEGHAEVAADDGDTAESDRLSSMVCDNPVISPADAEWMVEDLQDYDDEPRSSACATKLIGADRGILRFRDHQRHRHRPVRRPRYGSGLDAESRCRPRITRAQVTSAGYRIGTLEEVNE